MFQRNFLPKLGRRSFVRAAGVGAAAAPFLKILDTKAQMAPPPQRLLIFFSANGTMPDAWVPDGGERDFRFRRILEPLEPHRDDLLILQGIDQRSTNSGPGDGHQKGMGHILTGSDLLPGDTGGGCGSCAPVSWASSISIDQLVANRIGTETTFRSLELGVQTGGSNIWTRMVYRDGGEPLPPENDPYRAFERIFGDFDGDPFGIERRQRQRQSVLTSVQSDFDRLQSRLGRSDRERLQVHLDTVRELERRLETPTEGLGAHCAPPELGGRMDPQRNDNFPAMLGLQMDVATAAFACDLTRVASIQASRSVSQVSFPWIGVNDRHHDLSHEGDGNTSAKEKIIEINRWYATQFGELLTRLKSVPEPRLDGSMGTMLDNTLVVWVNELGKGNSHTRNDMPFVLAVNANGRFDTGRFLRLDRPHNDLWLTIARAYGVEVDRFGDPRFNEGELTALLA